MKLRFPTRHPKRYAALLAVLLLLCGGIVLFGFLFRGTQTMAVAAPPVCGRWEVHSTPSLARFAKLRSLSAVAAVAQDDVWFFGTSEDLFSDGVEKPVAFHWDGSGLHEVGSQPLGYTQGVWLSSGANTANTDVWAVGGYFNSDPRKAYGLVLRWNGATWSKAEALDRDYGYSSSFADILPVTANDIWLIGSGGGKTLAVHWNGQSWTRVPTANPPRQDATFSAISKVSPNNIWAVGWSGITDDFKTHQPLVEHWDGVQWSIVPTPKLSAPGYYLEDIAALDSNDVWAAGMQYTSSNGTSQTLIEHWNGTEWTVVPSPNPGSNSNSLGNIVANATDDVWAAGSSGSGSSSQALVTHWDGNQWSVLPTPNLQSLQDFVAIDDTFWAVGTDAKDRPVPVRFVRSRCGPTANQ